jgi:hypothetical protein
MIDVLEYWNSVTNESTLKRAVNLMDELLQCQPKLVDHSHYRSESAYKCNGRGLVLTANFAPQRPAFGAVGTFNGKLRIDPLSQTLCASFRAGWNKRSLT